MIFIMFGLGNLKLLFFNSCAFPLGDLGVGPGVSAGIENADQQSILRRLRLANYKTQAFLTF
jgi:hypothetical protein